MQGVCVVTFLLHSADIWQSSLTPLLCIRQACSTQQVAASRNCITAETLNATPLPMGPPFNYPPKSLPSPFYIFNTPDWPYAIRRDTCMNVV